MLKLKVVLILLLFLSCNNQKTTHINTNPISSNDSLSLDGKVISDFDTFYSNFIADSVFQIDHIKFPLEGGISYCDSMQILTKLNWRFLNDALVKKEISSDSIKISSFPDHVDIEKLRPEIGVLIELKFRKIEGAWYLVYLFINAC